MKNTIAYVGNRHLVSVSQTNAVVLAITLTDAEKSFITNNIINSTLEVVFIESEQEFAFGSTLKL
jgi:hypothetical protein